MSVTARVFAVTIAFTAITAVASSAARAQTKQQFNWCISENDPTPDQKISGCTAVIQAGKLKGKNLVFAFVNRGAAYYEKSQYDRAIEDFDPAVKLNPKYAIAFNDRCAAYHDKGELDRAIQAYDQAIKFDPKYTDAFFNRGNTYLDKGQYDRAIQDYDQAIKLNQNHAGAFYNRSLAKKHKGDEVDTEADLAAARKINPNIGR
jgi:tetratricopeptide (TPR) repeat protein